MSLRQQLKFKFAVLKKSIELRRKLTNAEIQQITVSVLEETKLLYGAVGALAVTWAEVELHLDFINGILVMQKDNAKLKLPKPLQARIEFFKESLGRVPELTHLREKAYRIVDQLDRLKEVRHDIIHGVAIERMPDGVRKFVRLGYAGQDITQRHASYAILPIVDAANEMRTLRDELFTMFRDMLEILHPEQASFPTRAWFRASSQLDE